MNLVLPLTLIASTASGLISAQDPDIVTISFLSGDFTALLAAWATTGIEGDLRAPGGSFTVFAPMDNAFESLPSGLVTCLFLPENVAYLTNVLSYHIIFGESLVSDKLRTGISTRMLNGDTIMIDLQPENKGFVINDNAIIVEPDIVANNGVVHAINSVLIPPGLDIPAFLQSCTSLECPRAEGDSISAPEMPIDTTSTLAPPANDTTMAPTTNETIVSQPMWNESTWNETTLSPTSNETTLPSTIDNNPIVLLDLCETIGIVESLQTLLVALEITGLADTLRATSRSSFTIFAPSDAAFDEMQSELVECLLKPEHVDSLIYILMHHILQGTFFIGNLVPGRFTGISGESLSISIKNDGVYINEMQPVIFPDIEASNGVIHIIDGVLIPPSFDVASFLTSCFGISPAPTATVSPTETPNPFDIPASLLASRTVDKFAAWLYASELDELLSNPNGPFTVFVPTNQATDALPESLTSCLLGDGTGDALWLLLSYHVVEGLILTTDMKDGTILETLGGDSLSAALLNGTVVLNNSSAIAAGDFFAANGVIHIISEVLISPNATVEHILELCVIVPPPTPVGTETPADASPPCVLVSVIMRWGIFAILSIVL